MSTKNVVTLATILKRQKCLSAPVNESTKIDSQRRYDNLMSVIEQSKDCSKDNIQIRLRSYIESMCDIENANNYYWQIIDLCEKINETNSDISDNIIYEYTNRILPYVSNLASVENAVSRSHLLESQIDNINESLALYNTADRISKNHNMISKRYNIEKEITTNYRDNKLKFAVDCCAEQVSTYSVKDYQKMSITLEEVAYVLEKNSIKYDKSLLTKYVVEYFLTQSPYIEKTELENYRRVLSESYILEENDLYRVQYLMNPNTIKSNSIEHDINGFLVSDKNPDELSDTVSNIINNTSDDDIKYNADKVVYTLWDLAKNKAFDSDEEIYHSCANIGDIIADRAINNKSYTRYNKEYINSIIENLSVARTDIDNIARSNNRFSESARAFLDNGLDLCIESLREVSDLLYSSTNLEAIEYVSNSDTDIIPLDEFKLFKYHNLVRAAFNLEKFLKAKEKKLYNNARNAVKKFTRKSKSLLFGEASEFDENIYSFIGEDCKADICVKQYIYEEDELHDISNFLDNVCNEYNAILESDNSTARVYYIINPQIAEVRIKESVGINLTEDEYNTAMNEYSSVESEVYIDMMKELNDICESFDNSSIERLANNILAFPSDLEFTQEQFDLALEAMSIAGINKDAVKIFCDNYMNNFAEKAIDGDSVNESYISTIKENRIVSDKLDKWSICEEASLEDKFEALGYLNQILEYSYPDSNDELDDEDDEDEDNTPKKPEVKKLAVNKSAKPEEKKDTKGKKPSEIYKDDFDINAEDKKAPKGGYKGGLNLASIKLALGGLKEKFKSLSTKEKEAARNFDNATRVMITSMKKSDQASRRQQIIKGSIVPSFSRIIKAGLILAPLAAINPIIPAIGAFGAYARDKRLTRHERLLLLDEIETEIEVVDKELSIADSNNQINKYRELLKYKKELQRQYQRIRYNIRIGQDITPKTSSGMVARED